MLKTVQKMVEHANLGISTPLRIGNYGFRAMDNRWFFIFFDTTVCLVDIKNNTVSYNDGGWKTSSTTRVINSYKEAFKEYREVPREVHQEFWNQRDKV